MIVDGLEGGDREQKRGLVKRHPSQPLGDDGTARIKYETLDGVVVPSAVRIRHVQSMMPGVDGLEQERVNVHGAMQEILPSVDKKNCKTRW